MQQILVPDRHSFLNPKEYVKLLYDDSTFLRSRIYFWEEGILPDLITNISQNIDAMKAFKPENIKGLENLSFVICYLGWIMKLQNLKLLDIASR